MRLLYSYSHRDETLRDELEKQLSLLKREGSVEEWHDRRIPTGAKWSSEIDSHLETADIILLLVSPDFLASDYCYDVEMKRAMERAAHGTALVVPIILRPCDWHSAPFAEMQALPRDGKAVTTWQNRDEAFLEIARAIRKIASEQGLRTLKSTSPERPSSDLKLMPKGLRPFDEHDADIFLRLLPRSGDQDGLPRSLQFWKTAFESTGPEQTFPVGLLYGPSGCGKSSFIKAGLIPRLAKHVRAIYIDATQDDTEARIISRLRDAWPEIGRVKTVSSALRKIVKSPLILGGQKAVLILDQFEQWLHANRVDFDSDLARALRRCDGHNLQCLPR